MRVIFLGRKPYGALALEHLIKRGFEVIYVVCPPKKEKVYWQKKVCDTAKKYNLKIISPEQLDRKIAKNQIKNIDLVISFLYWKKIKPELFNLAKIAAINFHPGPLPDFKGWATYNYAINQQLTHWGGTAHLIDENFDTGPIIKIKKFKINSKKESAYSLEFKTQKNLYLLFKEIINDIELGKKIKANQQNKKGVYVSKRELEDLKKITPKDSLEIIRRKIRAFWFPPFDGLKINIKGEDFTLINRELLKQIADFIHRREPEK